ncbi:MAG: pantetheine-phosphate adenylyltransferase [Firmicutes bacterium]|nr:pantetheine-phosphate adenylyltransferase [Bacillota bacterium]
MRIAVCPGSFDPITCGHLDVIARSAPLFDRLIVTVFVNPVKKPLFTVEERVEMIREAVEGLPNVEVDSSDGLLTEYARRRGACCIVKGLRAVSDFLFEFQMAMVNKYISPEIETVFVMTSAKYSYLSSSIVRELGQFGGTLKGLVPPGVEKRVRDKFTVDYDGSRGSGGDSFGCTGPSGQA